MVHDERRLVAIMFTDIVGYTAMTQRDEAQAVKLMEEHRSLLRPIFRKHNGTEIDTIGDAFLVEFSSALEAVNCAAAIQLMLKELNEQRPENGRILLRIGIHLGDVIHKGKKPVVTLLISRRGLSPLQRREEYVFLPKYTTVLSIRSIALSSRLEIRSSRMCQYLWRCSKSPALEMNPPNR